MMHGTDSRAAVFGTLVTLCLHGALCAQDTAPAPLPQVPEADAKPQKLQLPAAPPLTDFPKLAAAADEPVPMPAFTEEQGTMQPPNDERPAAPTLADLAGFNMLAGLSSTPSIPTNLAVESHGADIRYDAAHNTISYQGSAEPIHIVTDSGADIYAGGVAANLEEKVAELSGPLTLCQGEMMMRGTGGAYRWESGTAELTGVRAKVNGLIVRGSRVEYGKDAQGRHLVTIHDAYVSTEDVEEPSSWVGTGTLRIVPGDYASLSRLSLATSSHDVAVPVLGWFSFSHSLNPKEGYMPSLGTRSYWGFYVLNSYGVLLGNRRVEGIMPTADYLATLHTDVRTRRGFAFGLDFQDIAMARRHEDFSGIKFYYAPDRGYMINPTDVPRSRIRKQRYYGSMQAGWEFKPQADPSARWSAVTNVTAVSDRYMLRDFFTGQCQVNDKPDNTVRVVRTSRLTQSMLYTRFAPNNYYATDERVEGSFYRVRTPLFGTRINYETRSGAGIMRQYISPIQRMEYENALSRYREGPEKEYYTRLLNTDAYARVNTTHEFTTDFKVLRFLNVTPKAGVGYSGYYGVGGIGSDNRFMGYLGCDFDIRLQRHFSGFHWDSMGYKGLTHVLRPYTSFSHMAISSSNALVPRLDCWSTTMGASTSAPMAMDLCSFTGIDGWGKSSVWRFGMQNTFSSVQDGERRNILDWHAFVDYNADNPNSVRDFSNLYSLVRFNPGDTLSLRLESLTPTFRGGEDFHQYNVSLSHMPCAWFEYTFGARYIEHHPIQQDSNQLYAQANLRINECYTLAGRAYMDITEGRSPLQQLSLFRNSGAWYVGVNVYMRDNGGKREFGVGLAFTLEETGTTLPVHLY